MSMWEIQANNYFWKNGDVWEKWLLYVKHEAFM